jgi:hypothetical protein
MQLAKNRAAVNALIGMVPLLGSGAWKLSSLRFLPKFIGNSAFCILSRRKSIDSTAACAKLKLILWQ